MLIAVDLDDTLEHFNKAFWQWHKRVYGFALQLEEITDADWSVLVKQKFNLDISTDTLYLRTIEFLSTPESLQMIKPVTNAHESLSELRKQGHKLIVITGRSQIVRTNTEQWVNIHYPNLFDDLVFTDQFSKQLQNTHATPISKHMPKVQLMNLLNAQILIDDMHYNFMDFDKHDKYGIIFEQPWNKKYGTLPNTRRTANWQEILNFIQEFMI